MSQTKAQLIDNLVQPITGALGSAAAPTFSFTADPNTGLFSPGADAIALATAGTNRLHITSAGLVGIGSTTALGYKLNIYESGTGMINALHLGSGGGTPNNGASISFGLGNGFDPTANILAKIGGIYTGSGYEGALTFHTNPNSDGASPRERARIDSSGRLLVGTSTSNAPGSLNSKVQVEALDFTGSISAVRNSVDTGGPQLVLGKSRGTSLGAKTIVASGDSIGSINFFGADGTNFAEGASIQAAVDGTPGANDLPSRLVFSTTADGGSSPTERMRITNDGAVLIGSSSSALNSSTDKVKFAVGGTGSPTRGIWMSGTIPASTTYTVNLGSDQPSGFLVLTIASDQYAPSQPSAATNTQTQLYLVVPLRGGAAGGSKTLVSSIIRGAPHGTIVWTNDGTSFTIQNTSGSALLWYEVQYRL